MREPVSLFTTTEFPSLSVLTASPTSPVLSATLPPSLLLLPLSPHTEVEPVVSRQSGQEDEGVEWSQSDPGLLGHGSGHSEGL